MSITANIWSYIDLIQEKLTTLSLWFPVYAGKPIDELDGNGCFFYLVSNGEKVSDDSQWVHIKESLFEFVLISGNKNTPDVVLYEMLDSLVNKIILEAWDRWELTWWFTIQSIREWNQTGVFKDVNDRPYIIAQFFIIYQSRYATTPRI